MKPATAMACWRRADIMPLLKALLNTPFGHAPLPRYFRFQAALMLKGSLKPFLARGKILPLLAICGKPKRQTACGKILRNHIYI
ncbi:hypothetical protein [Kingella bonacorsii]|uniref:Uncharacterized protein n=1 Tax=Kingella bonacorsii TaxID=2796361 RepID=A0ABS1BP05_9NEIS|nr:hypothetical protein [Kingella bonacorsii]MBK0395036.1 hypothetical protein [Kingella bonacorsii]